jgi:predicted Rossmann fold flavoprotein
MQKIKRQPLFEGELLFADFGLTGPAVMEISREVPADVKGTRAYLELDLVPSMNEEAFESGFMKLIDEHADTKITTLLSKYVPASVAGEIASRCGISDVYAQGFTKENRKKVCRLMKHLKIGIGSAPSIEAAYVMRGGVSLKEVDRKTMGSKVVPGLYVTGEALDIDGISGGYNLQACMSEAYLAAKDILSKM